MAVGIKLGSITDEIGAASFLTAFFDTITVNLEPDGRGSRFPTIAERLYAGEILHGDAQAAIDELRMIKEELSKLPLSNLVWDIEDRSAQPPWGENVADSITDLSNYFVTSTGRDLIGVLEEVFDELRRAGGSVQIVSY